MSKETHLAEGFPHQRLVIIPANIIQRCKALPLVKHLYITHIGSYPSAPGHYVERTHTHQVIMIYCLKGTGYIEMDHSVFRITKGTTAFIPPGTPHIYRSDEEDPWSIFWIHFTGEQAESALASLKLTARKPTVFVPDTARMRNAFEDIYACLNYHYSDAGLLAMTSGLMRLLSIIKLLYGAPQKEKQAVEDRIMDTIGFMKDHLSMSLSLDALAKQAGLSVPHYSKLFRQRTSQSPMAYFIQLKMRKACELLQETEHAVQEIARQLGYDDPFFFSRQFKKIQGVSPAQYRSQL
ncbi:AraC family transcriptional regulator [Pontiella agarivorans]|uniref:AraC family transcriptional regulator n=1 Tax=Pontiella agarivorans TaxID=3038953 RepID=A0ABU5MYS1_9BACT|nr:AraC family transcriptional regulator [Pontiella agarivorans]MDZ8119327.1 AraC family transcriptional regulator [Pontiella agarivorans]